MQPFHLLSKTLSSRKYDISKHALMLAADNGDLDMVKELSEFGAKLNKKDEDEWAALVAAAKNGYFEIVQLFLEKGAEFTARDERGWDPLMWGAYMGFHRVV